MVKYEAMSIKTLMNILKMLGEVVTKEIYSNLPKKFGLYHDCWSNGNDHYMGIFASYCVESESSIDVKMPLLAIAPMVEIEEDEDGGDSFAINA